MDALSSPLDAASLDAELTRSREALARSEAASAALRAQVAAAEAESARLRGRNAEIEQILAEGQRLSHSAHWEWDAREDKVHWSSEMYRFYGLAPDGLELTYARFLQLVAPADRERVREAVERAVREGTPYELEYATAQPARERRLFALGEPVRDDEGAVVRLRGTVVDITERHRLNDELLRHARELRERNAFVDRLLQSLPAVVASLDADLRYRVANPAYEAAFGEPGRQVIGRAYEEVFPQAAAEADALLREMLASGRSHVDVCIARPKREADGTERLSYWDMRLEPLFDEGGAPSGILLLGVEVSQRVEKERLQREKIEALERAETLKTQFLGILSHELRTPINGIMGFASILEDEIVGALTPQQHDYALKILGSSERLLALVEDLLDMSRIQAGKLALSPRAMGFSRMVVEAAAQMAPILSQKQHALRNEVPEELPAVRGDEQRIGQVLLNLLSNAHKFTAAGGTITVRARVEGEWLRCEVADTGEGIAAEDLPKLFQPFTQLDMSATRKFGGAGLGLSICKSLIEAHGGQIGVSSMPGRGATFWFTLPLAGAEDAGRLPDEGAIAYNEA